jgi:hypothetical protein
MTLVQTTPTEDAIYVTVDSANTIESNGKTWVIPESKTFLRPGAGLVVVYGNLGSGRNHLRKWWSDNGFKFASFEDLHDAVMLYILEEAPYLESFDFGYHVAGYSKDKVPCLYNIWVANSGEHQTADHRQKAPNVIEFVYNGRHDLAHPQVTAFLRRAAIGRYRYDVPTPRGIIAVEHDVVRSVARISKDVAGPFFTYVIRPDNSIKSIRLNSLVKQRIIDDKTSATLEVSGLLSDPAPYETAFTPMESAPRYRTAVAGISNTLPRYCPSHCIPDSGPGTVTAVSLTTIFSTGYDSDGRMYLRRRLR